ncbi:porin [Magnetovibrio blakemorei]|nr:porin [Magnetovibrio blakemorei]
MKKILLGTTAVIALGSMTTEAFAADKIQLSVGGFMKEYLGITNSDEEATTNGSARDKDISQYTDTEIHFKGSTTLDSGIKVAATIEVEADQDGGTADRRNVDRSFLTISSDAVGSLVIGSAPHFGEGNLVRVPNASGNFDWDDLDDWGGIARSATGATGAFANASATIMGNQIGGDSAKLSYTSPTFSGVSVGASYTAAEAANASDARRVAGTQNDGYTYGIHYSGDLGGAAVNADVTRANHGTNNTEITHAGLTVGMAGFTVGGGYSDVNDTQSVAGRTLNGSQDGNTWELGVSYATGPYTVSAAYMKAEQVQSIATAGDDKDTAWKIAATYDMGAGVALTANYFNLKADPEGNTALTQTSRTINGVIAGIEVGF